MTAMNRLQRVLTSVDAEGKRFDLFRFVRYETERRRVLDGLVHHHQDTARGTFSTDETCRELKPNYNDAGVREFNQHIGFGHRAFVFW